MAKTTPEQLIQAALQVRENAYSPYYKVNVGAALLDADGGIHVGCNVENASGSAVSCAEAGALSAAIAKGKRKFTAVAVVGFADKPLFPCGVCRQRLSEFMKPDAKVYVATTKGEYTTHSFGDIFPHPIEL